MISLLGRILDFLFPRQCAVCEQLLAVEEDCICASCNLHLERTLFSRNPYDNEMAKLFWKLLPVERCAALFYYQGGSAQSHIIYNLKYNDRPDIGIAMGKLAAAEFMADGFFNDIDWIIPLPLAKNRKRQRGYNQSDMIAQGVEDVTGIKTRTDVVGRKKYLESQTHLQTIERQENVKGVFILKKPEAIHGKHILIIDDICTTGASIVSLGEELCKAGDVKISILTLGFARS